MEICRALCEQRQESPSGEERRKLGMMIKKSFPRIDDICEKFKRNIITVQMIGTGESIPCCSIRGRGHRAQGAGSRSAWHGLELRGGGLVKRWSAYLGIAHSMKTFSY